LKLFLNRVTLAAELVVPVEEEIPVIATATSGVIKLPAL
jgi:hypothetical protein